MGDQRFLTQLRLGVTRIGSGPAVGRDLCEGMLAFLAVVSGLESLVLAASVPLWLRISVLALTVGVIALRFGFLREYEDEQTADRRAVHGKLDSIAENQVGSLEEMRRALDTVARYGSDLAGLRETVAAIPESFSEYVARKAELNAVEASGVPPVDPRRRAAEDSVTQAWAHAASQMDAYQVHLFRPQRGWPPQAFIEQDNYVPPQPPAG